MKKETPYAILSFLCLALELRPLDGPPAIIRVDPARGFIGLRKDYTLLKCKVSLDISQVKKNPIKTQLLRRL